MLGCLPQPLLSIALQRQALSLEAWQMTLPLTLLPAQSSAATAASSGLAEVLACCACAETRDDPGEVGTSLFVEPLQWMQAELDHGQVQGKLYCPG